MAVDLFNLVATAVGALLLSTGLGIVLFAGLNLYFLFHKSLRSSEVHGIAPNSPPQINPPLFGETLHDPQRHVSSGGPMGCVAVAVGIKVDCHSPAMLGWSRAVTHRANDVASKKLVDSSLVAIFFGGITLLDVVKHAHEAIANLGVNGDTVVNCIGTVIQIHLERGHNPHCRDFSGLSIELYHGCIIRGGPKGGHWHHGAQVTLAHGHGLRTPVTIGFGPDVLLKLDYFSLSHLAAARTPTNIPIPRNLFQRRFRT